MKNIKVRTKLTIILALVIVLVTSESFISIKNMNQFSIINDIYKEYFNKDFPARSCVEVARLPKDVLIEIEAVAVV